MTQSYAVWIFACFVTSNKKQKLTVGWGSVHNEKLIYWYVSLEMIMATK